MNIKPFRFKLKKVSAKDEQILSALFDFLPKTGRREAFHDAVTEALTKHLGSDVSYSLESVSQGSFGSYCDRMPDPAVLIVLGMPPREGKIILEIDQHLAALFIDKLLGGTAEAAPAPRVPTDTEQGVLQYLLLQVLAHMYRLCGQDARLLFRFEKFVFSPKGLRALHAPEDSTSSLSVKFTIGQHDGFIRLFFPSPLIEQLYLNAETKADMRKAERLDLAHRLSEMGYVQAPLWAEAGSTTVTTGEMKNLEAGDVILFDKTDLILTDKGPAGRVTLRTGSGTHGGLIAEIEPQKRKVRCHVVDIAQGERIPI